MTMATTAEIARVIAEGIGGTKAEPLVGRWLFTPANLKLKQALETASIAVRQIEPEHKRLRILISEAKSELEIAAREYQMWYVEQYLTRAESVAKKRLDYFKTVDPAEELKTLASGGILHWFEYYAWGYDPRARTPLSIIPFALFPKQKELVEWLDKKVFFQRSSGLIEKSRDEGATETIVRFGVFHWLFTQGFSMLFSTRKEDEVDSKKNQNTVFERARFQLRLLPDWMLPKGFDLKRDMLASMQLANPENQNTLLGEAPVANMGRGGRVTCAMLDEFAFWPFAGYPQYRSLSQTSDSFIIPSSVAGRLNQYADLAFDGITDKFVMDWRDHPLKDKRWYDSLPFGHISPKMSKTTIAQEVDRNYDAAQPGKVWVCPEELVFITMSEFLSAYKEFRGAFFEDKEQTKFKIPDDWRVTRCHDYGQSEGHDWAYLIGAQPRANYPFADTHFIFAAKNLEPTGLRTEQAVAQWREIEHELGLRDLSGTWKHKPYASYHSHEQKDLRSVLMSTYGEHWQAWITDYDTGIERIQDWWTPVDNDEPNPFRPDLYGRCKLVFVAPDGEYQAAFNERLNTYFVTIAQSEAGFATCRKQISAYHYPESELGKAVKAMRPVKQFDDIVDALRGYAVMWNRDAAPLTFHEELHKKVQERTVFASEFKDDVSLAAQISRSVATAKSLKELRDDGWDVDAQGMETERDFFTDISGGW